MERLLKKARIVDIHEQDVGRGRKAYVRHETSSDELPLRLHRQRAALIDKAGKRGATDLPGRHVGVIVEHPDRPATRGVASEITDNPASGLATMLLRRRLDAGARINIPSIGVTITKDDLPSWFHPKESRRRSR